MIERLHNFSRSKPSNPMVLGLQAGFARPLVVLGINPFDRSNQTVE